jgi:hypothetical protein
MTRLSASRSSGVTPSAARQNRMSSPTTNTASSTCSCAGAHKSVVRARMRVQRLQADWYLRIDQAHLHATMRKVHASEPDCLTCMHK